MTWEGIYWHVWGACVVLQPTVQNKNRTSHQRSGEYDLLDDNMISASDVDRYTTEVMGISVHCRYYRCMLFQPYFFTSFPTTSIRDMEIIRVVQKNVIV